MSTTTTATSVGVTDEVRDLAGLDRVDYADAFRATTLAERTPEQFAKLAVRSMPRPVMGAVWVVHRGLGLHVAASDRRGRLLGWERLRSDDHVHMLASSGPLVTARIVTTLEHGALTLTTLLRFESAAATPIWSAIGPAHRAVARRMVERAAAA